MSKHGMEGRVWKRGDRLYVRRWGRPTPAIIVRGGSALVDSEGWRRGENWTKHEQPLFEADIVTGLNL